MALPLVVVDIRRRIGTAGPCPHHRQDFPRGAFVVWIWRTRNAAIRAGQTRGGSDNLVLSESPLEGSRKCFHFDKVSDPGGNPGSAGPGATGLRFGGGIISHDYGDDVCGWCAAALFCGVVRDIAGAGPNRLVD